MAEKILNTFGNRIQELTLIPSGGGVFEIELNGSLEYSKKETRQFPEEEHIIALIREQL